MQMRTYIFPSLLCLFLASCGNNHYNPPLSSKLSVSMEEVAYDSYMALPQGNETFSKDSREYFCRSRQSACFYILCGCR